MRDGHIGVDLNSRRVLSKILKKRPKDLKLIFKKINYTYCVKNLSSISTIVGGGRFMGIYLSTVKTTLTITRIGTRPRFGANSP